MTKTNHIYTYPAHQLPQALRCLDTTKRGMNTLQDWYEQTGAPPCSNVDFLLGGNFTSPGPSSHIITWKVLRYLKTWSPQWLMFTSVVVKWVEGVSMPLRTSAKLRLRESIMLWHREIWKKKLNMSDFRHISIHIFWYYAIHVLFLMVSSWFACMFSLFDSWYFLCLRFGNHVRYSMIWLYLVSGKQMQGRLTPSTKK